MAGTTWLKLKPSAAEMVARCPPPASSTSVTLTSPMDLPEPSSTVPRTPPRYDWLHDAPVNNKAQRIVFAVIYVSPCLPQLPLIRLRAGQARRPVLYTRMRSEEH